MRPYTVNVAEAEYTQANKWWRSLSNNQMDGLEAKYCPHSSKPLPKRMIHQIWEEEGKPEEQEPIPIPDHLK